MRKEIKQKEKQEEKENIIKKNHRKFKFHYPKFLALAISFILAYFLFKYLNILGLDELFGSLGYLGTFLTGMLFAYGFTAAPATALFLVIADSQNIWLAIIIGALGATTGDYFIFRLIKTGFSDELKRFERTKLVKEIDREIPVKIRHYLVMIFAELMIVSPLPNEIGISMLAMEHHMTKKKFALISFILSIIGITIILLVGKSV